MTDCHLHFARSSAASPAFSEPCTLLDGRPRPPQGRTLSPHMARVRYVEVPPEVRTTVLRITGDRFSYSTPLGTSFTARIGGDYVPIRSEPVTGQPSRYVDPANFRSRKRIKQQAR